MKLFTIALASLVALPTAAFAGYGQRGYSNQCFKEVYREEYTPGTVNSPGYIRSWTETVEIRCVGQGGGETVIHNDPFPINHHTQPKRFTVTRGMITLVSKVRLSAVYLVALVVLPPLAGPDMGWAIPLGVVGGSLIGCQVDGG
jgi:hypothetical protein